MLPPWPCLRRLALAALLITATSPTTIWSQTPAANPPAATAAATAVPVATTPPTTPPAGLIVPEASPAERVPPQFRGRPLNVVLRLAPPFVMKGDDGKFQGFSMDLWAKISKILNFTSNYTVAPTLDGLLDDAATGRADIAFSAISITAKRDEIVDFSLPMYHSGLQIAIRAGGEAHESEIAAVWAILTRPTMLNLIGLMLLTAIIVAHVVWLVERRHEECGVVEHRKYIPGIFKAFWWSMGTIGSQVDEMPRTWLGRGIAIFWMFCAIVFVAYFTAAATTSLTVQSLKGAISGPDDLPGKALATVAGSTSIEYLAAHHLKATAVPAIADALKLLENHQVEAVVYDAPVLQYYAANDAKGQIQVVGDVFHTEDYGFVFANDSTLRSPVDTALLEVQESGEYQKLVDQWFKTSDAGD